MESRDDSLLRERLAALPQETPPAAAWTAIRKQLEVQATPRAPRQLSPWWLALAAAIAAVVIAPALQQSGAPDSRGAITVAPEVAALMQRSRSLESEIRGLRAASPDVAETQFDWESAIESDLALVDVGLAARGEHAEPLWRERVRLLEELKTASQMDTGPLLLQARLD
ncbi:MAG TPA: hypothetical protein VN259_16095 [Xanthomonadales bacterium]|nr:hypothetical protein [Xanthomonadales bacterium]